MASRSLAKRCWYDFLWVSCRAFALVVFRMRRAGVENIPSTGGGLILAHHQSHLDPILVGLSINRRLYYVARQTLFRNPLVRWLIQAVDTIPIDREGSGLAGLKATLRHLKDGELVVLFPEGTRTPDGEVQRLKPGFSALARRAEVPIIPVAMDGAYDAWPRSARFPRPIRIALVIGEPLAPEEIARLSDD